MSPETIVAALLAAAPGLAALVDDRVALKQLPEGTTQFPAMTFNIITGNPKYNLNPKASPKVVARFQINPIARDFEQVKAVHACVRTALENVDNTTVAGKLVVSCRTALLGPSDVDDMSGIWTQPVDYLLTYHE